MTPLTDLEPTSSLELLLSTPQSRGPGLVARVLAAARELLDADIAFVAQLAGERGLVCRFVEASPQSRRTRAVAVDRRVELDDEYLAPLRADRSTLVVADAGADVRLAALPGTADLAIGSFVGVPLHLADGRLYGALCCIGSPTAVAATDREVRVLEALARLLVRQLGDEQAHEHARLASVRRIRALLREGAIAMAFQPIVRLATGEPVGVEALARFPVGGPAECFAEAGAAGLGVELELLAATCALEAQPRLGDTLTLAVNVGPAALTDPRFLDLVDGAQGDRLVVELTEHARVDDYAPLLTAIGALRERGAKLAIDDAGAGYAGLSHILSVGPDVIKLDIGLVRDVHRDPVRAALAASLVSFAGRTGASLIAEGVETRDEADALLDLGVEIGQGYLFARPGPLPGDAPLPA